MRLKVVLIFFFYIVFVEAQENIKDKFGPYSGRYAKFNSDDAQKRVYVHLKSSIFGTRQTWCVEIISTQSGIKM
mgnify:FL=1